MRVRLSTWLLRATGRGAAAARCEVAARCRRAVRASLSSSCTCRGEKVYQVVIFRVVRMS